MIATLAQRLLALTMDAERTELEVWGEMCWEGDEDHHSCNVPECACPDHGTDPAECADERRASA